MPNNVTLPPKDCKISSRNFKMADRDSSKKPSIVPSLGSFERVNDTTLTETNPHLHLDIRLRRQADETHKFMKESENYLPNNHRSLVIPSEYLQNMEMQEEKSKIR